MTYQADISFINLERDDHGRATEASLEIVYQANTHRQAALSAKLFALGRLRHCGEIWSSLSAIKIFTFTPWPIILDTAEYISPARQIFEWKCDYPGAYEDWAARLPNEAEDAATIDLTDKATLRQIISAADAAVKAKAGSLDIREALFDLSCAASRLLDRSLQNNKSREKADAK